MKEVFFIRQNIEKWRDMEQLVDNSSAVSPDELATAYEELAADLSFSQTQYPQSRITLYLNNLALALHNVIYVNKREKRSRLLTFWTQEMPQTVWEARKLLLASAIIFFVSVFIGVVSTLGDPDFPRLIMGDFYIDMTLENIKHGQPMSVYGNADPSPMFLSITMNNILVSFNAFVLGLFTSFGTGYILFSNGIMVGAFQAFFFQHGLLGESMLAIWLHGTLEISSIIVAGAAGLSMGNGWLMPGTYGRLESFKRGAKRGMKIVVGTVPIFIVAGFIESFVTRHTELPVAVRLGIILLSLIFVVGYFIFLPWHYATHGTKRQPTFTLEELQEQQDADEQ